MAESTPQSKLASQLSTARFWLVFIWALSVGAGVGVAYWAYGYFNDQANQQTILLVPDQSLDDQQRSTLSIKFGNEPGITSASWLTPAEQARRLQSQFPDDKWRQAYPADEDWLPWVMEVKPENPLSNRALLTAFIARRQQEGGWQSYWDGSTLDQLVGQFNLLATMLAAWTVVILIAGIFALKSMPKPARPWVVTLGSAFSAAIAPLFLWAILRMQSISVDDAAFAVAAGAGFILACAIAPVLRSRRISDPVPERQVESTFSTTVAEAPDERVR
ncbi:hypothetical protein LLG95_03530 [bacterium]|nr:hypothetical protein [bacterium]